MPVWIQPGPTALTRIPCGPSSSAIDFVSMRTPPLDAL